MARTKTIKGDLNMQITACHGRLIDLDGRVGINEDIGHRLHGMAAMAFARTEALWFEVSDNLIHHISKEMEAKRVIE